MAHHSTPMPRAGWRVASLSQPQEAAADSSFAEGGWGLMTDSAYWIGGLFTVALWTGLAWVLTR